jgi:hypothetical protein
MALFRTTLFLLCCSFLYSPGFCTPVFAQQDASPSSVSSPDADPPAQTQSLGDIARRLRKDHTAEVQMSAEDAKTLFQSVDKIFAFDSGDTGFPKRSTVKRELVGRADVEKYTRSIEAKQGFAEEMARSEMTMKKFGFLPRDFDLRDFLVKANGKEVAGYYDEEKKTVYLLNWIPLEHQAPVLAHELTHALQDQNYNLQVWAKAGPVDPAQKSSRPRGNDESELARHAVVEGQATLVMLDYMLAPFGRSVLNTPGIIYQMEDPAVRATYDSELLHNAPMILRESGTFPYQAGLIFEGELLHKGGQHMAFAGAFARPPRNTHEVLQPQSYIDGEKLPPVRIPDVQPLVSGQYEVYDSGSIGELDVRALLKQYGDRRVADDLSSQWRGGAYVTFRRTAREASAITPPSTADLALVYVSRWRTPQAAERFAHLYTEAVSQRYQTAKVEAIDPCSGSGCPSASAHIATEEGPVIIEQWADGTVLVSEGFSATIAAKLRDAVRDTTADAHADNIPREEDELGLRLYAFPGFAGYQAEIGQRILDEINRRISSF